MSVHVLQALGLWETPTGPLSLVSAFNEHHCEWTNIFPHSCWLFVLLILLFAPLQAHYCNAVLPGGCDPN